MDARRYALIEDYMLACMRGCDSAHDAEHIRRVLGVGLDIAAHEPGADVDVVIAACLLHDIGRMEQMRDPALCHAAVGAEKARAFLEGNGFGEDFARRVADCVRTHRFRKGGAPESVEARILYDADKVDVCGAIGVARTIFYQGHMGEPLYTRRADGRVSDGAGDETASFFQEYCYKLEGICDRLLTRRGAQIARERNAAVRAFYAAMLDEVRSSCDAGERLLEKHIQKA